ncbi:MbtH family NRPS accessory protein [Streptomyces sp. NPDC048623]|uniref:MbtH family protein n=1 Tax=Streptomyces sp. NPDC048623 TaxID=3155761 RepID=UPI0034140769
MSTTSTAEAAHCVVVNDEDQYSLWPHERPLPDGWRATGFHGSREECLAHVDEVWTDMRPLSLRG